MILIIRENGQALNINSAHMLTETRAGLLVDFGLPIDGMFIIEDFTLSTLYKWTEGHYSNLIKIPGNWMGVGHREG